MAALGMIAFCAMAACVEAKAPWLGAAGLGLLGGGAIAAQAASTARGRRICRWTLAAGSLLAWIIPAAIEFSFYQYLRGRPYGLAGFRSSYFALAGWVAAATILPLSLEQTNAAARRRLRAAVLLCGAVAGSFCLAEGYGNNLRLGFYVGVLLSLACLILCLAWFRLPRTGIQTVATLMLLLAGLPAGDWLLGPRGGVDAPPDAVEELRLRHYSYSAARGDPAMFARWADCFSRAASRVLRDIGIPQKGRPRYRLHAGARSGLFESAIVINSRGFRGREIPAWKGQTYRIVALGESTTFGCTLRAEDQPWPEVLEQLIRQRLKPPRRVEVINAGAMAYDLEDNLARLERDILPLEPDLIISYHGFNGFRFLDRAIPPLVRTPPPAYQPRPLRLLAACEHRLRLLYWRSFEARTETNPPVPSNLWDTDYAKAYRQLVDIAQAKGIRLAIATFAMAVNARSDLDVIDFYRPGFPHLDRAINANEAHSTLVRELARRNPSVLFIDTRPGLDGRHEKFIDVMHFTQEGRRQLAETMFTSLCPVLEEDLLRRRK